MTWFDITFYELFPKIFNMSITGTLIILAVIFVRFLLKKAPKIYSYALWAVVLFRLLCPVSFSLDISLLRHFDVPVTESGSIEYVPSDIVHMSEPSISTPIPAVNDVINNRLPQGREQLAADPLEAPVSIITFIWICGMIALLSYSAVQYFKLRRCLVGAIPLRDNICLADYIDSPFVMGIVFPKIYLPSSLSKSEQEYVILHEKHHIKRGDHIIKILTFIALCIHWFNPFVWLAFALSGKDMEMSCDEAVMHQMDHDIRVAYATSLLRFATGRKLLLGTPLAFGEGDTKSRVKNVMTYKKPLIWVSVVAGAVIIVAAVFLIANPAYRNTKLFGAIYDVKQVLYYNTINISDEFVDQQIEETTYCITADYGLYVQYNREDDWNYLGAMEHCASGTEIGLSCTTDDRWRAASDIKNFTDAYYLYHNSPDKAYVVLQTKSGDTLLCYGQMHPSEYGTDKHKVVLFDYILQLESTFYENYIQANFFMRTLEHAANTNVDTFAFWQSDYMPGYMIVGFVADDLAQKQQDMRDMGFAVFQSNNGTGYKLLDYHIYKDAALIENGIYMAADPAVCDLNGTITDESAFDVIFSTRDSNLASVVRVLDDGTEVKRGDVTEGSLNMILFHWADQADSKRVKQYYYDSDGNIIEDTGVIIYPDETSNDLISLSNQEYQTFYDNTGNTLNGAILYRNNDVLQLYYYQSDITDGYTLSGTFNASDNTFILATEDALTTLEGQYYTDTKEIPCLKGSLKIGGITKETFSFEYIRSYENYENYTGNFELLGYNPYQVIAFIDRYIHAMNIDDKNVLAGMMQYPLSVLEDGNNRQIEDAHDFVANYDTIITEETRKDVLAGLEENLFGNWRGVHFAGIWFYPETGIYSINNNSDAYYHSDAYKEKSTQNENIYGIEKDTDFGLKDPEEIKEIVTAFSTAYFERNADVMKNYLTENLTENPETYPIDWGNYQIITTKGLSDIGKKDVGATHEVCIEFKAESMDSFAYLTIQLIKQDDSWKISFYGLEL